MFFLCEIPSRTSVEILKGSNSNPYTDDENVESGMRSQV